MTEFTQEQYQKFFDEFEKAYREYENKVKERRAREFMIIMYLMS